MTHTESIPRRGVSAFVREVLALCARYPALAANVGVTPFVYLSLLAGFDAQYMSSVPFQSAGLSLVALALLTEHHRRLVQRIDAAQEAAPRWAVHVNDVSVGTLSDAQYAAIKQRVYFDASLYRAHVWEALCLVLQGAVALAALVPGLAFWAALVLFVFAPDLFAQAVSTLRTLTPAQVAACLRLAPTGFAVALFAALVVLPTHPGRRNRFGAAFNEHVRWAVGCAADGHVWLSQSRADAPRVSPLA